MANTVITSTTAYIKAVFNNDSSISGWATCYWAKDSWLFVANDADNGAATIVTECGREFRVAYQATEGCWLIDSVNGVAPTSNADLTDKLGALL